MIHDENWQVQLFVGLVLQSIETHILKVNDNKKFVTFVQEPKQSANYLTLSSKSPSKGWINRKDEQSYSWLGALQCGQTGVFATHYCRQWVHTRTALQHGGTRGHELFFTAVLQMRHVKIFMMF